MICLFGCAQLGMPVANTRADKQRNKRTSAKGGTRTKQDAFGDFNAIHLKN
jgi:hypothetical protein